MDKIEFFSKRKVVIAIDFDDTITENSTYPITGNVRKDAKKYIPLISKYADFILYTCRGGKYLTEAIEILKKESLWQYFKTVNEDILVNYSSKVLADIYFDDRGFNCIINYKKLYEKVCEIYYNINK